MQAAPHAEPITADAYHTDLTRDRSRVATIARWSIARVRQPHSPNGNYQAHEDD